MSPVGYTTKESVGTSHYSFHVSGLSHCPLCQERATTRNPRRNIYTTTPHCVCLQADTMVLMHHSSWASIAAMFSDKVEICEIPKRQEQSADKRFPQKYETQVAGTIQT